MIPPEYNYLSISFSEKALRSGNYMTIREYYATKIRSLKRKSHDNLISFTTKIRSLKLTLQCKESNLIFSHQLSFSIRSAKDLITENEQKKARFKVHPLKFISISGILLNSTNSKKTSEEFYFIKFETHSVDTVYGPIKQEISKYFKRIYTTLQTSKDLMSDFDIRL